MASELEAGEKGTRRNTHERSHRSEVGGIQEGETLEQLISFIKENWKTVLTDLVTAGVNAYLVHGKKNKEARQKTRHIASH